MWATATLKTASQLLSLFAENNSGATKGEQKAEFGLRGGGLRMFFADAESKNFLCRRRRSGGGDIFSSIIPICYYRIRNYAESRRSRS